MNLERVQKYYELIDRELGLESEEDDLFGLESEEDDLFGFESEEDDLFGFESEEEDLFGFEADDDLFGFESDEDDLFGTEGVKDFFVNTKNKAKGVIKKSFAFVMNILKVILAAITSWWKNKKIKKLVSLLKKHFGNKDAKKEDVQKLINNIELKDTEKKEFAGFLKSINALVDKAFVEKIQKYVDSVKDVKIADFQSTVDAFSKCTSVMDVIKNADSSYSSAAYALLDKKPEDFDNLGKSLSLIMKLVAYVVRKTTQFYQRKGETWFMQEADKSVLENIKKLQTESTRLIKGTNDLLKGLTAEEAKTEEEAENTNDNTEETKEKPKGESIMSDIKEMMAANESLNDIIFDMEMDI